MNAAFYDRGKAVAYARQWALGRNKAYYDYSSLGGDCTNFASQCLYAGSMVMDYNEKNGWFYAGPNHHSPSWTGVTFLYEYLTGKTNQGPFGHEADIDHIEAGDISQFQSAAPFFTHTQVIVSAGKIKTLDNILVAAHTLDCLDRPLSSYVFNKIRFIHIDGVRK